MPHTVIIGAGISGLTCAYQLMQLGDDVLLLEASNRAGGVIGTERLYGYLLETGPNTLRGSTAELEDLLDSLRMNDRIVEASAASNTRSILRDNVLRSLPRNPLEIFSTSIISAKAKLRAVREPFVAAMSQEDETIDSFFTRRFGSEVAQYLADPFVSGVYAGDKDMLSIRHTFPSLWKHEHERGSVIKGMLRGRKKRTTSPSRSRRGIYSFKRGLAELPQRLEKDLGARIACGALVSSITRMNDRYEITLTAGSQILADRVILATPAYACAPMLKGLATNVRDLLAQVRYAPIATLHLGFANSQFSKLPQGFGFLVPSREKKQFLGCIFSSSMFADRAPAGHTLLTVMIGGSTQPELARLDAEELSERVLPDLRRLLSITGEPLFTHLHSWNRAIPQYEIGYQVIIEGINEIEQAFPGLHLLGSYRGGVSVGDCIRNATELAQTLV